MTNWASVAQRRTTGRFQHTQVLRSGDCWRGSKSYHCSHTVKTTDRRRSAPLAAAYVYVRVEASLIGSVVEASLSEGWPFRGGLNFTSPTELFFFETRRRRWGQCRDQEPLLEFSVDRVPRKVQALVWDFGRVVAHKEGSNSGLIFGSTRWAPIMGAHLVRPILGPENDLTFGAHFRTDLNRFSSPTTKHKSGWGENLGVGNHSSGGGSPHGSSRCSYKIVGGKANPYSLGKNTLPLR